LHYSSNTPSCNELSRTMSDCGGEDNRCLMNEMPAKHSKLVHDVPKTLDLRLSANLFQAFAIFVISSVGGIIGYRVVSEGKWYAAATGVVFGVIVATCITGFIVMLLPQPIPMITPQASVQKYIRFWYRFNLLGVSYLLGGTLTVAWTSFQLSTPGWLSLGWFVLFFSCCGALLYHSRVLDQWRCPKCEKPFGRQRLFRRFPHRCRHCEFAISNERDAVC